MTEQLHTTLPQTPLERQTAERNTRLLEDAIPRQGVIGRSYGLFEQIGATYRQEALVGAMASYGIDKLIEGKMGWEDPGFNPYQHFDENSDELSDMHTHMRQGLFQGVTNESQFRARVERLRKEQADRDIMAQGGAGVLLGGVASIADVTSLIPFYGWGKKLNTVRKVATFTANAAGGAVVQEALLHQIEDLRTFDDSISAVAGAALFGAGLGGAASISNMARSIRKANAHYNTEKAFKMAADQTRPAANDEVVPPFHAAHKRNVGAAEAQEVLTRVRGSTNGKWATFTQKTWHNLTPASRAARYLSNNARKALSEIQEMGGVVTDDMAAGKAHRPAESIAQEHYGEWQKVFGKAHDKVAELNLAMGQQYSRLKEMKARVGNFGRGLVGKEENLTGNAIEQWEFAKHVYDELYDDVDEAVLMDRYGDPEIVNQVRAAAKEIVQDIHKFNEAMEQKMVDAGMITEDQRMGKDYRMAQLWNHREVVSNPDEFRAILMEEMAGKPDDDFLSEVYDITQADFDRLGLEDVTLNEKVETAQGTEFVDRTVTPEQGARMRNEILDEWAGSNEANRLAEAEAAATRAHLDYEAARQESLQSVWDLWGSEAKLRKASIDEAKSHVTAARARVEKTRIELDAKKVEETELTKAAQGARQKELDRLSELMPAGTSPDAIGRVAGKSKEVARLEGELFQLSQQRRKLEKRLESSEAQTVKAEAAVAKAEKAKAQEKAATKLAREIRKEHQKKLKSAKSERVKAYRAKRKLEDKSPLEARADELVELMQRRKQMPNGLFDDADLADSGRVQRRMIHLSAQGRKRMAEAGFLRDDIFQIMTRSAHDLSARLALRETFDSENLEDVAKGIRDDYEQIKQQYREDGRSTQDLANLDAESAAAVKDLFALRDRLLGTYGLPDDPEDIAAWSFARARDMNFVRYGMGFLVSSITDLANIALTSPNMRELYKNGSWTRSGEMLKDGSPSELRRLLIASEMLLHNSRTMMVNNTADFTTGGGIAAVGSRKQRFTSATERAMRGMAESVNVFSGMQYWNTRMKAWAMVDMQHNMVDMLGRYDSLDESQIGRLASLGIGEAEARYISNLMKKYPPTETDGVFEFGVQRWREAAEDMDDPSEKMRALDMATLIESALVRASQRAVMTPGIGDTPLLMSKPFFKTLLQFQTYGFVVINRMLNPAAQRVMTYQDMTAAASMAMALGLGAMVVTLKDLQRGYDVTERTPSEFAMDALDRSGILAAYSPYVGALRQLTGDRTSRYAGQRFMGQLGGPSYGLIQDYSNLTADAISPDQEITWGEIKKVLPYKPIFDTFTLLAE